MPQINGHVNVSKKLEVLILVLAVIYFYTSFIQAENKIGLPLIAIGTASAYSLESNPGCTSSVYFNNVTLTSQKPCQCNK